MYRRIGEKDSPDAKVWEVPYVSPMVNSTLMNSKTLAYLEAAFAATVWGASFIATKVSQRDIEKLVVERNKAIGKDRISRTRCFLD